MILRRKNRGPRRGAAAAARASAHSGSGKTAIGIGLLGKAGRRRQLREAGPGNICDRRDLLTIARGAATANFAGRAAWRRREGSRTVRGRFGAAGLARDAVGRFVRRRGLLEKAAQDGELLGVLLVPRELLAELVFEARARARGSDSMSRGAALHDKDLGTGAERLAGSDEPDLTS